MDPPPPVCAEQMGGRKGGRKKKRRKEGRQAGREGGRQGWRDGKTLEENTSPVSQLL